MENKSVRRLFVLHNILHPIQVKNTKATVTKEEQKVVNFRTEISMPPEDLQQAFYTIFSSEFMTFLSKLHFEFDRQIEQLYYNRQKNNLKYSTIFTAPTFLNSSSRNDPTWKIGPLPPRLQCRNIDLGDVSPSNTEHLIESLRINVQGIQVDFDDGHCPTWKNQIIALHNVYKIVHGLFENIPDLNNIPILMLRPRAWNMIEHNIMINGKKVPGPLVDFAALFFHNAQKLSQNQNGPFFYLSKLESAIEAKLWNDIFIWSQNQLNIPVGTIKACVLIENIIASFEMHEILYELREHSLGLNCGIWDYAASIINKFGVQSHFMLPDRNKYVNMDKHFLKKYMELVIQTCHSRGAPATGGMAAQLLLNGNDKQSIEQVVIAKTKEIRAGCDGFLIYDKKLLPFVEPLWEERFTIIDEKQLKITEIDLLQIPSGSVTLEGLKHNIEVSILFIYHWFLGIGHFYHKKSVEDSATAEISRSQIWQWIRHEAKLEDSTDTVTKTLIDNMSHEFLQENLIYDSNILVLSTEIFMDVVTAKSFVNFITTYLNDSVLFRSLQHKFSL